MSQQVSKRVEVLQTAPAASDLALYREPITNPVAAYLAIVARTARASEALSKSLKACSNVLRFSHQLNKPPVR